MLAKLKALREEREDGFTLIELLVVILIIGILSAIAIPVFLNQRKTANDSAVQSDVKNAASQVESWLVSNNNTADFPAASAVTNTDLGTIKVSEGVTITITKSTAGVVSNGYTICGYHDNGKQYTGLTAPNKALVYNSADGGLKGAQACPAAPAGATKLTAKVSGIS